MESSAGSVPLPPLFPNSFNFPPSEQCRGTGQLSWLSPKAGLISSINCSNKTGQITVSFQLKDFCDVGVSDLTSVLRVGFRLAFSAVSATDSNDYIANYVAPISDSDLNSGVFNDAKELDLETIEQNFGSGVRQAHKDPYSLDMELQSLYFLLSIFHKSSVHFIPLSSLHSRISNSGKEDLYRYIGSSSLKRRQFIERRSYIFHIAENDVVFLQPPEIYTTVCLLTGFLLSHGGVTSSDALFSFFNNSNLVPSALKDTIKTSRVNFMTFLSRHPFAFAPFPSQFYVSVRRNLPYFDYNSFIKKNFPACVFPRTPSVPNFGANRPLVSSFNGFDNDNVPTIPTYHPPTTPMTPLFQEDPLVAAQKVNRGNNGNTNSVWQNEIGYFDHHSSNNNLIGLAGAPPGKVVPIVGSTAIVGRGSGNNFTNDLGSNKMDFPKIEITHRPTELNLRNSNSPILQMGAVRKSLVDSFTQTDPLYNENQVERPIGFDSRCRCKCTCQMDKKDNDKCSNENLTSQNGHGFSLGSAFIEFQSSDSLQRQRPVSVQEQPVSVQRPLFSAPVGSGRSSGSENSASSTNLFNSAPNKPLNDLDSLNDSFFDHTLQSFASAFLPITNASSLVNCFASTEFSGFDSTLVSADSAVCSTASSAASTSVIGQQVLPMPIGGGPNGNSIKNCGNKDGVSSKGSNNSTASSNTNSLDSNASASQERLYDPFGKPMPFELKLSSLKL